MRVSVCVRVLRCRMMQQERRRLLARKGIRASPVRLLDVMMIFIRTDSLITSSFSRLILLYFPRVLLKSLMGTDGRLILFLIRYPSVNEN